MLIDAIRRTVTAIAPWDETERRHREETLAWLSATDDVFRRVRHPVEPTRHLVSYFLLVDAERREVLLGDHVTSGLWLPSGGHVEPGEDPVATVSRECREELGIEAVFLPATGEGPLFLTVTDTVGDHSHTDVSLWYCLAADRRTPLRPDPREYHRVRWWRPDQIAAADPSCFDPHLPRMLDKLATRLDGGG